ncbi:MAG: PD-(D/E)XK nuclease family protein [Planctomycetes bacterium]|nr:PD-(D/E)XK nuclease family protein [Planctomycetota bacterium]
MSVRFILGRAGTGKTHHCLGEIRARLAEEPAEGHSLVLLVPEQASLQMERAILAEPGPTASHRAEVVSFRRLAYRVLAEVGDSGSPPKRALTDLGRAMALEHLLTTLTADLRYFRHTRRRAGFVRKLSATVAELIGEAIHPGDILRASNDSDQTNDNPLVARKLWDLGTIYQGYLDYLGTTKLDPSQYLELARERLASWPPLQGAHLWMDGFAWLSRQEQLTVVALAGVVAHLDITVMIDPARAAPGATGGLPTSARVAGATGPGAPGSASACPSPPHPSSELFSMTEQLYADLHRSLSEAGVAVEPPVLLPTGDVPPRFADTAPLVQLERTLFQPEPGDHPVSPDHTVEVVELPDRRVEVEYAVATICRWVRPGAPGGKPMRYREMAIIAADLEPYHDLLAAALSDRDIPFFIDRRRPMTHHPLVELLSGLIELRMTDFSVESVRLILKTGLLGLADSTGDALENYLLATGLHGAAAWRDSDWPAVATNGRSGESPSESAWAQQEMANVLRERAAFLDCVGPFCDAGAPTESVSGSIWADRLAEAFDYLDVGDTLEAWARSAADDGDLDQAELHRQVWRDVTAFLKDLGTTFEDQPLSVRELSAIVDAGLSQLTLGLAPPMLDQVLVGSIDRSRHPDLRATIVLGFSEGMFPAEHAENAVLNDEDRNALAAAGSKRISRPRTQKILDDRLLFYVAVTRASERVVITYPAATDEGKSLAVSPYLSDLLAACPGLEVQRIEDPQWSRDTWGLLSSRDVSGLLTAELNLRPPLTEDSRPERALWNRLYDSTRVDDDLRGRMKRSLSALTFSNAATVRPDNIKRLTGDPLCGSVSSLETQAACPFKHFAQYSLRLRERKLAELEAVDIGRVHHAMLEDFIVTLISDGRCLGDLLDGAVMDRLSESCQRVATRPASGAALSTAREAYILRRSRAELARVVQIQRRIAAAGGFRPRATEVKFGFSEDGSLPAVVITTPKGRRVQLRGFIDRVDLAEVADEMLGVVIDYKSRRDPKLDLSEVYYGLSLQLLGYLLALADGGQTLAGRPVKPVGAFYISLKEKYDLVAHPAKHPDEPSVKQTAYRPRGVLDVDRAEALDGEWSGRGPSAVYAIHKTKEDKLGYVESSDAVTASDYAAMLDHTRHKLGELADGIMDGEVAVKPYRLGEASPCTWCSFGAVCRFEFGESDMRFLESLKRSEVLEALRGDRG